VLAVLALVSLALIPVRITTIYGGLPAHPLLLHVPVVLIPVVTIGALAFAAQPRWISRYGVALATLTVIALAGTFLTVGAGFALRSALHIPTGAALIARHAHAARILRALMIAFTAGVLVTLLAHRVAAGRPTGNPVLDGGLARRSVLSALRVVLAGLAIACAYFVFHTGDLGAKAVWHRRLSNRAPFGREAPGFSPPGTLHAPITRNPGAP